MATIQQVFGKYDAKKSQPGNVWVLLADEQNIFEVPEWMPQIMEKLGVLTPPLPSEIDTPKQVTWKLFTKDKKEVLHTFASDVLKKLPITINKKYSGSYSYFLEAELSTTKEKAGIYIQGNAPAKVTTINWGKDKTYTDKTELKQGDSLYTKIETEGLNGDKLKLEVYDVQENKSVKEIEVECINGNIEASFNTLGMVKVVPNTPKIVQVKIKAKSGVYIKDASSKEELVTFTINDKVEVNPQVPQNITPLKIGEPDASAVATGFISLERVAVDTEYDVCNDEVAGFDDYKNFWILKGKISPSTSTEYYHWIKKSDLGDPAKGGNAEDTPKPSPLPITLSSEDQFKFTAVFKTIFPLDGIKVRVRDRDGKYKFKEVDYPKGTQKQSEYEVKFEPAPKDPTKPTVIADPPYKGTVQHFPNFELIFEYSLDGKSWTPLGSSQFCLYLTWKKPEYSAFQRVSNEIITMQVELSRNGKKPQILETLLWISCKNAKTKGKDQEEILDAVFKKFESLSVERARKAGAMGYWRNTSSANPSSTFINYRSLRYLLSVGEARCGEWTEFLIHIAFTQGIKDVARFIIVTEASKIAYYPLISKTTGTGALAKTDYSLRQYDPTQRNPTGDFLYTNYPVPAKNAPDYARTKDDVPSGYDSSSGSYKITKHDTVPYDGHTKDIVKYDTYIDSIFLVKSWKIKDPDPPEQLSASAQGNTNPLNFFWDHVFLMFTTGSNKKYYDPSYGAKSTKYYSTDKELLKDYSIASLSAVVSASIPKAGGGKAFEDKVHTKQYVDLFKGSFQSSASNVQKYMYKSYTTKMEDHLIKI